MTLIARGGKYQINIKQPPLVDLLIFVTYLLLTLSKDIAADTWLSPQGATSPLPLTANPLPNS